jgi:hypothetical protein
MQVAQCHHDGEKSAELEPFDCIEGNRLPIGITVSREKLIPTIQVER